MTPQVRMTAGKVRQERAKRTRDLVHRVREHDPRLTVSDAPTKPFVPIKKRKNRDLSRFGGR